MNPGTWTKSDGLIPWVEQFLQTPLESESELPQISHFPKSAITDRLQRLEAGTALSAYQVFGYPS